jgi:hypothetical protein
VKNVTDLPIALKSFLEWNSDPEVAVAAERLYGDIDHLELYVGLQTEEAKPLVDGAGLCPGELLLFDVVTGDSPLTCRIHC